ncbi:MAG: OmpA family protein [bacterium]
MDESSLDFNFWPSFADIMLSIVLVLVLVLFLIAAVLAVGVDIGPIRQKQEAMIRGLEDAYNIKHKKIGDDFIISFSDGRDRDMVIRNDLDKQLLMFSDHVLFPPDVAVLSPSGRHLLSIVGNVIKKQLVSLKEIQIQGHADTDPSSRFPSNLELAAARAIEVFQFFKDTVCVDPSICLMSATSFGEYKPSGRSAEDSTYNQSKLVEANTSVYRKAKNRRVEVLLFYRN